jgi:hypothetical protein
MNMSAPNLADFTTFLQDVCGFNPTVLPTTNPVIGMAYQVAITIANQSLAAVPLIYTLAVYNLGADNVVRFAQDQPMQTFFGDLRKQYAISSFTPGVVSSAGDEGTNSSLLNPKFMQNLTLSDLQNLKTPWGLQYLSFAQMYGPSIWGVS